MEEYTLVGVNGNAFSVMGYVSNAMRECKFTRQEIDEYRKKAMSGNYDNLIAVSLDYIDKCNEIINTDDL